MNKLFSIECYRGKMDHCEEMSSVIYISRIPHGFYEDEMFGYFSQFGKVINVSVSRNKKGKSKHFGFVKFESTEVAKIAAETMNNYLMFNVLLKCKQLMKRECFSGMFNKEEDKKSEIIKEKKEQIEERKEQKLKTFGIDFSSFA